MKRCRWLGIGLLVGLLAGCTLSTVQPTSLATPDANAGARTCPLIVAEALAQVEQTCSGISRDQVCYGNVRLDVTPRAGVTDFNFSQAGDVVGVADIASLRLSSMDIGQDVWGIALMRVRATVPDTLPGQGVTMLLFGDVEIRQGDQTNYGSMGAFYFRSGFNDRACAEAPDSGILVQTPAGVGTISLLVNEVQVDVGSTLYMQAQPGAELSINTLQGIATATAFGVTQVIPAGSEVRIPLDANGVASGPPTPAQPYDMAKLISLPLNVGLPDTVTIVPPATVEQPMLVTPTPTLPLPAGAIQLANGYILEVVSYDEVRDQPKYELHEQKPFLSGPDRTIYDPFNREVDATLAFRAGEFMSAVTNNPPPPAELGDVGSSIQINTELYTPRDTLISLRFNISQYLAGAAHPFSVLNTLTYDLTTGSFLALADLFTPGSNYLETLSAYAVERLRAQYGDALFAEGAAPTEENYRNWNLTPDGLLISFEQYQAGPGAAGTMEALIPYSQLVTIIRRDGVLAQFLG
jgi:hypothetical protein